MKPLPIFFALIGLIGIIPLTWQTCVQIVLYLVVFEGAIRKWVVPGAEEVIYFIKDLVMIAAYIKFYLQPPEQRANFVKVPVLKLVLIIALIIPILHIFHPGSSILFGLFGIRGYILYMPLMFLLPSLFRSKEDFVSFIRNYLMFSLGVCLLSLVQYVSPGNSFINRYASDEAVQNIATMGSSNNVRATGTFSYISGFGTYLTFCFAFSLPLLTYPQSAKKHFLNLIVLLVMMGGFLVSGSRGPIFNSLILLVLYIALNKNLWGTGYIKKFLPPIIFICLVVPSLFSTQLTNFIGRTTQNKDATERLKWVYSTVLENINDMSIFGYGTGSAHPAETKIGKLFGIKSKRAFGPAPDIESGKIMLELGLIGFVLWYLMRLYLVIALWRTYHKLKTDVLKNYALVAFLLHLLLYAAGGGTLVFNVTLQVYYWFAAGFILLLPELDLIEQKNIKTINNPQKLDK